MKRLNRFALTLALLMFVLSDFSGATFTHAVQRAVIVYFAAALVQGIWRWVLWPWIRSAARNARREEKASEPPTTMERDQSPSEMAEAA